MTTKICTVCKRELLFTMFYKRKKSKDGLTYRCKDCAKKYRKKYYSENKEKWIGYRENNIEHITKTKKERREKRRLCVLQHYGGNPPACSCCGESHIEFLTIDHINNDGAEHRRQIGGSGRLVKWIIDNDFPEGFRILCYNCNCSIGNYGYCPHDLN